MLHDTEVWQFPYIIYSVEFPKSHIQMFIPHIGDRLDFMILPGIVVYCIVLYVLLTARKNAKS